MLLDVTLAPVATRAEPADDDDARAIRGSARGLRDAASSDKSSAGLAAGRVARLLDALADGAPAGRRAFADAVVPGLRTTLAQVRASLRAKAVTVDDLPEDLRRDWIASDGRARIEIFPRASAHDPASFDAYANERLRRFVAAVRSLAPEANGPPVSIQESAATVIGAFVQAGISALIVIALLLAWTLRRAGDVLRTLTSLLLGGLATLGACTALGIAVNYENIIALPLLFGVGVAFNIYFVVAWRRGEAKLLETSIARAVVFSALTTATAFGSLWLSSHPGTASMGELLALALACTLASALLVLPALLGPPDAST